jgi:serine/threonine protein kinase
LPFAGIRAEACAVARLAHPYVAKVYDYGEVLEALRHPVPFVVMELLPGVSLGQLAAFGPMQPASLCASVPRWPRLWLTPTRAVWSTAM